MFLQNPNLENKTNFKIFDRFSAFKKFYRCVRLKNI